MGYPSVALSIIFGLVCAGSAFLGVFTLSLHWKSRANLVFFALCMSLCVWALGFSFAISAANEAVCLFWRRISAFGWSVFFSLMLHFMIELTGNNGFFRKRWRLLLLYAPSAVTVAAFTFTPLNPQQYHLVHTALGWVNVAVNNFWDWFYTAYYASFSVAGLILVWRWGKKAQNAKIKSQAKLIVWPFIITMLAGSLTDIFGSSLFSTTLPQMAPLLMALPITAVFYSIFKYGLLNPKHVGEPVILMNDQVRARIFNYLSAALAVGAILNFLSYYFTDSGKDLPGVLLFSLTLVLFGALFQVFERSKIKADTRDILNTILFSCFIPVVSLRYIDAGSITTWTFPFIILILSLVFGKRFMQVSVIISTLVTQALLWALLPNATVRMNAVTHTGLLFVYLAAIWFASFVNRIFLFKLRENACQISSQKLISELSFEYMSVKEDNFGEKTNRMLERLGNFFELDRIFVFLFGAGYEKISCPHRWCKKAYPEEAQPPKDAPSVTYPRLVHQILSNAIVYESDMDKLPAGAVREIRALANGQVHMFIALPVLNNGNVLGFLFAVSFTSGKALPETQINIFKIISNIFADALAKVRQEGKINQLAYYDHLTHLPNRQLFKDRLNQAVYLAKQTNAAVAIMLLDIDSFKAVNDTIGHERGDHLLIKVAHQLRNAVHPDDTVSRFGGDEFLILFHETGADIAGTAAAIMNIFEKPFMLHGQEFFITASAGLAVFPADGGDTEQLIKNADIAMNKAKANGKNQFVVCSTEMKQEVSYKMKLSNSLYRVLEKNEVFLHYQPLVCLNTKEIVGVEALLRWKHPEMGAVAPGVFIPLAEQNGLICPIGEWVLKTACRQNKAWQDAGFPAVRVAVNVSAHQWRNPNFVHRVKEILSETGLHPKYLELEVTESAAIHEADYIIKVIGDLKKYGLSVSIDDFGTEYSSLSRLKLLPVDKIKMDMQFIRGISGNEKDQTITKAIISLAQNLGLKVIAEGVETITQLEFLSDRMCDEVQGFYYYEPLSAQDMEKVFKSRLGGIAHMPYALHA